MKFDLYLLYLLSLLSPYLGTETVKTNFLLAALLLSRLSEHYSFGPNGHFAVYQDRSTISALTLDQPAGLSSMKTTGALSAQSASSR